MLFDIKDVTSEKIAEAKADDIIDEVIELKGLRGRRRSRAINTCAADLDQLKAKCAMKGWSKVETQIETAMNKLVAQNMKQEGSRNDIYDTL